MICKFLFFLTLLGNTWDGWVTVPRSEKIFYEVMGEDRSIWVVFAKKFESERMIVRFPQEPEVTFSPGQMKAVASFGEGELSILVCKKEDPEESEKLDQTHFFYRDPETSLLVHEMHVETGYYSYILSCRHPSESVSLSHTFFDSFELY